MKYFIFVLPLVVCLLSWILQYCYYLIKPQQIDRIVYHLLPRSLYGIDRKRNYSMLIYILYILTYISFSIFLIYIYRINIDMFLNYLTNISFFPDIFLVQLGVIGYMSIMGITIFIYYIVLNKESEQDYDTLFLSPIALFSEAIENLFYWGIIYIILIEYNHIYDLLLALYISIVYAITKLSFCINSLRHKVFPMFVLVNSFTTMFFSCLLIVISEHIIYPILYNTISLFVLRFNRCMWLKKIHTIKRQYFGR